ncbi:hypothetical protein V1508DRAFT_400580 [Lipomyces doorenjongii]|uniref:uncharacterized protein n=1 Tax=Lipomyces doorenjongii TaxID=383834 RepID=UPI0034CF9089
MTRPSSKSIEQSINGRKNILKRFDRASQAAQNIAEASGQDADARGGQDAEELQVVEVRLRQSEIDNALKRLWFLQTLINRKNQEQERSRAAEEEILADRITDNANGANAMNSDECDESAAAVEQDKLQPSGRLR